MAKFFYEVKAAADKVRIDIYGDIVADAFWKWSEDDKCPSDIVSALRDNPTAPVEVHINSGGGDAFSGEAIYNILKMHAAKKTVYVDGLAASSASYIAMAGDEIYIPKTAHLMVHKPWTTARMANANDLRKAADMLDSVQSAMVAAYMSRAAESIEESAMIALVDAETWMTGDVAAKYFKVITTDMAAAACASDLFDRYSHVPDDLKAQAVPPVPPATDPPKDGAEHEPPASDEEMTVGDELALVSSFLFTMRNREENNTHDQENA